MRRTLPCLLAWTCFWLTGCTNARTPATAGAETVLSDGYGPECHASTLVALPDGSLAAAWFSGAKEGADDVVIRFTRQAAVGGAWSHPVTIADHHGTPCWNPVLFVGPEGSLTLFYKVAKHIPDWTGWFRTSRDGGHTWSEAQPLPAGFLGPIRCHALPRPDGAVLFGSSTEAGTGQRPWRVHFERCAPASDFRAASAWTRSTPADDTPALNAIQPSLLDHGQGRLVAYARTREGVVARTESSDDGRTWSPLRPATPRQANPNSGLEALLLPDGREALVLNPGQDRRRLEVVVRTADNLRWERLLRIDETAQGEVSYPSAFVSSLDGQPVLHVSYTRRRREIVLRTFSLPTAAGR